MKPPERSEERAPIVYLSETADWSTFTSTYKGEPHRNTLGLVFEFKTLSVCMTSDSSIDEIYSQMLENHTKSLLK